MSGRHDFEFGFSRPRPGSRPARADQDPRRILIMADLGGRAAGPISARPIHEVDLDTFDEVFARIAPHICGGTGDLEFGSLEHFHPDRLLGDLPACRSLLDLRKRLLDPATFAAAAAELGAVPAAGSTDATGDEDAATTLERLLGRPAAGAAGPAATPVDMTSLIRDLVAPYIVPDDDPRADACVATVDAAIGDQLRAILHDPAFQALEATWRGIDWLRTELELGEDLQLFVCHVTRDEMLADVREHAAGLDGSELFRLVHEQEAGTPGGRSWSLLLGDYCFGAGADDVDLLAALGAIASRTGAPLLAGAKPGLFGCPSLAEAPDPAAWSGAAPDDRERWFALRRSTQAAWLALAWPRILLRLPYGERAEGIETIAFEELTGDPDHETFLWGNAAYACVLQLVNAEATLDGLPAATVVRDGTAMLQPCAEVLLSERAGRSILDLGVVPLLSHRDRNAVSIPRVQSLADPARSLEGW